MSVSDGDYPRGEVTCPKPHSEKLAEAGVLTPARPVPQATLIASTAQNAAKEQSTSFCCLSPPPLLPSCPQAQMPLHATSLVRAEKPCTALFPARRVLSSVPVLEKGQSLAVEEKEGLRAGVAAQPPTALRVPSSRLFSACQGDRDQLRPAVPGHCLPQPCPEGPLRAVLQHQRRRSQAVMSERAGGRWEGS